MRAHISRTTGTAALLAAAVAAAGCGAGDHAPAAPDDALARDLARAEEVAAARGSVRTRFVSALEAGRAVPGEEAAPSPRGAARTTRASRTRERVARVASHTPAPAVAAADAAEDEAEAPARAAVAEADEAPAAEPVAEVATAPSEPAAHGPAADEAPASPTESTGEERRGRRGRWGRILGGIGGVVIRGGAVDGDNCERDVPRRRPGGWGGTIASGWPAGGGALPMPTRGSGGIGGTTFPRY